MASDTRTQRSGSGKSETIQQVAVRVHEMINNRFNVVLIERSGIHPVDLDQPELVPNTLDVLYTDIKVRPGISKLRRESTFGCLSVDLDEVSDPDALISKIESVPLNVKEWRAQKEVYASRTTDVNALGFATFYLNRTNRSGVLNGGPIGGVDQTGNDLIDARFNREDPATEVVVLSDGLRAIAEGWPPRPVSISR